MPIKTRKTAIESDETSETLLFMINEANLAETQKVDLILSPLWTHLSPSFDASQLTAPNLANLSQTLSEAKDNFTRGRGFKTQRNIVFGKLFGKAIDDFAPEIANLTQEDLAQDAFDIAYNISTYLGVIYECFF